MSDYDSTRKFMNIVLWAVTATVLTAAFLAGRYLF